MNLEDRKKKILTHSSDSFTAFLQRTAVGICEHQSGELKSVGSGTCIKIDESYYICTAAHVVENKSPENIIILYKKNGQNESLKIDQIKCFRDDSKGIDVAYIKIPNEEAESINKTFICEDAIGSDIGNIEEELVLITGFPVSLVSQDSDASYIFQTINYLTIANSPDKWTSGAIVGNEIEIKYPVDVLDAHSHSWVDLPDAPGISGGGVWILNINNENEIWTPQSARLIGVNRSWHKEKRWVKATLASKWIDFVKNNQ